MRFLCHVCGNTSFVVSNDQYERTIATCSKCGTVTPFEEREMMQSIAGRPAVDNSVRKARLN